MVIVNGFVLYVTDCLNQHTHLLIKSVSEVQVMYLQRFLSSSSSLLCCIWQMLELPAKHDSFTKAVGSWHSSTHCSSFTVLSPPLHSPRNPSKCLYPQLPTGTPLHLHPRESWEIDVREDKGTELWCWMRAGKSDMKQGSTLRVRISLWSLNSVSWVLSVRSEFTRKASLQRW